MIERIETEMVHTIHMQWDKTGDSSEWEQISRHPHDLNCMIGFWPTCPLTKFYVNISFAVRLKIVLSLAITQD